APARRYAGARQRSRFRRSAASAAHAKPPRDTRYSWLPPDHAAAAASPVDADARASSLIICAPFSPIMIDGALVLPVVTAGMIEASMTRSPSIPMTLRRGSTTAIGSVPILQVPTG